MCCCSSLTFSLSGSFRSRLCLWVFISKFYSPRVLSSDNFYVSVSAYTWRFMVFSIPEIVCVNSFFKWAGTQIWEGFNYCTTSLCVSQKFSFCFTRGFVNFFHSCKFMVLTHSKWHDVLQSEHIFDSGGHWLLAILELLKHESSFVEATFRPYCFFFFFPLLLVLTCTWFPCSVSIEQSLCSRYKLGGLIGEMRERGEKEQCNCKCMELCPPSWPPVFTPFFS